MRTPSSQSIRTVRTHRFPSYRRRGIASEAVMISSAAQVRQTTQEGRVGQLVQPAETLQRKRFVPTVM